MVNLEIAKAYDPSNVEERLYEKWLASGLYRADAGSPRPAYSLVIPPPNVTGVLTLGHVLNNTVQDILARRARLAGHEVLWLPGTDHAGIATQTVVERQLRKEGKSRHDLGREEFLKRAWEWKEKHGGIIISQLKRLGCSCDWSRERFTMDAAYAREVQQVFVDLYHKGLIYRGKRMVNWCPVSQTALSDEEVIPKPQRGRLVVFRVEVVERPGTFLEIATTRPETIMGDTAVAVNPRDERYARLVGLRVRRPLPAEDQALIPIVADEAVDMAFGTGALKVTPAHDKVDYEIGQRHGLEAIEVIGADGRMSARAGAAFAGLDRFEAREKAIEALAEVEALVRVEPYENNVGFSERADVPVEPRLSEQWFLRYPKVAEARAAVAEGKIRFHPKRWEKVFDHWMENIQDWCISRQLWWGHRIPVWWACDGSGELRCQVDSPGEGWEQDPDVLDTWFSSWLWAHATMDEPTRKKFYPTNVLVTGPDIIFFWVARMIMASLEYTGEVPFREVYFTGIIRDKQGRKMSKSLGNSPDPLDLISKYGADGLRFGLLRIAPQGQDIRFDESQIVEGRNFCNKLWNACRFRLMHGVPDGAANPAGHELTVFAREVLARLDDCIRRVDAAYEGYRFNEIAQALYDFVWGDFCDRFLEAAKADLAGEGGWRKHATLVTLDAILSRVLRLLHPFVPFITEELWLAMGYGQEGSIQQAGWPDPLGFESDGRGAAIYEWVAAARNARATYNLPSNRKLEWRLRAREAWLEGELGVMASLLNASQLARVDEAPTGLHATVVSSPGTLYLPLEGIVNVEAELTRLREELAKAEEQAKKARARLEDEKFVNHAPAEVVEEHRRRCQHWQARMASLQEALGNLCGQGGGRG